MTELTYLSNHFFHIFHTDFDINRAIAIVAPYVAKLQSLRFFALKDDKMGSLYTWQSAEISATRPFSVQLPVSPIMTILKTLDFPFSDSTPAVRLPAKKNRSKNRISVIIGENGTRKSFLLRQILEQAVTQIRVEKELAAGILDSGFAKTPSKVVAVSSIPTDRFPSKPAASDRLRGSKYDVDHYSYIGPRTAGNILSRNQSVDTVIRAILENPGVVSERASFLNRILSQLDLCDHYTIGLDLSTAARTITSSGGVRHYIERRIREAQTGRLSQKAELFSKYEKFASSTKGRHLIELIEVGQSRSPFRPKPNGTAAEFPFFISVDTLRGGLDTNIGGETDALRWAMEIGYLRPARLTFTRKNGQKVNQDDLSAGQWSLFSVMTSLALSIQDNTLILLDEPESGLHPAWQRTFLDLFNDAISHAKGCHALVATHSPLILSSLNPESSDLISITRDLETDTLTAELGSLPLGWDTSLILQDMFDLEDARAPKLTALVDSALRLIAQGVRGNAPQLKSLVAKLQPYYDSLPEEDVGKGIIESIFKVANKTAKS